MSFNLEKDFKSASSFLKIGDFNNALSLYNNILIKYPHNPRAAIAIKRLQNLKKNNISSSEVISQVNYLFKNGSINEAIKQAQSESEINPSSEIYNALGAIFTNTGDFDKAEKNYKLALSLNSNNALIYNNLGKLYEIKEEINSALKFYKIAIKLKPDNLLYFTNLSNCLMNFFPQDFNDDWLNAYEILLSKKHLLATEKLQKISQLSKNFIMLSKVFNELNLMLRSDEFNIIIFQKKIESLSEILLFHLVIEDMINTNIVFEAFLENSRKKILLNRNNIIFSKHILKFIESVALHCYTNDYILYETKKETTEIKKLETILKNSISSKQKVDFFNLCLFCSYRSLSKYSWKNEIIFPYEFLRTKERFITLPLIEKNYKKQIQVIDNITDLTSRNVKDQYEENPYPKWIHFPLPDLMTKYSLSDFLKEIKIFPQRNNFSKEAKINILVAGCGTGHEAISIASLIKNCHITAIDLSASSLAYGIRKAKEFKINNIDFIQCDIMNIKNLNKKFDVITSSGVLHHMEEPFRGWKNLDKHLKTNGLMKICLYSKTARRHLKPYQEKYQNKKFQNIDHEIREFRKIIINGNTQNYNNLSTFRDFFNLSELRDLIFHVKEHQFTIPKIHNILEKLNHSFCGFENIRNINNLFDKFYGTSSDKSKLKNWEAFENSHKDSFLEMYTFWAQKN